MLDKSEGVLTRSYFTNSLQSQKHKYHHYTYRFQPLETTATATHKLKKLLPKTKGDINDTGPFLL